MADEPGRDPQDGPPEWDAEDAQRLLGSTLLVGLTNAAPDGATTEQLYGEVVAADPEKGICIRVAGKTRSGEHFWLPPALPWVRVANPASID